MSDMQTGIIRDLRKELAETEEKAYQYEEAMKRIVRMADNHEWVPYAAICKAALKGEVHPG